MTLTRDVLSTIYNITPMEEYCVIYYVQTLHADAKGRWNGDNVSITRSLFLLQKNNAVYRIVKYNVMLTNEHINFCRIYIFLV